MKPVKFKEYTTLFGADQPEYLALPCFRHKDEWKCVSSCWGLSLKDRIKALFTGRVWVTMATFGKPLNPVKLSIEKPDFNN